MDHNTFSIEYNNLQKNGAEEILPLNRSYKKSLRVIELSKEK